MVTTRKRRGDARIYAVAEQFLERGWRAGDSVFTPGRRVWTLESFEELRRVFVVQLDETSRSFEEKLKDQLSGVSDDAVQLFAELFCLHLLISSMITPPKKRELIEHVLGLMDEPPDIPEDIAAVFGLGMVNPGTYFNTGRHAQLGFLIELGRSWWQEPADSREAMLADPWRFKDFAAKAADSGSGTQFRALLHLLFSETFEAIVSIDHRKKILSRFGEDDDDPDPDRQLQQIRERLTSRYGEEFDFYDERLQPLWKQGIDPWPELAKWIGKLVASPRFDAAERDYKLEVGRMLADVVDALESDDDWRGPLGLAFDGKYQNLVRWQTADSFLSWVDAQDGPGPNAAADALRELWTDGVPAGDRVSRFAERVDDVIDTPGERVSLASFLLMGSDPLSNPPYKPTPFAKVHELVGRTAASGSEQDRYEEAVAFCAELRTEAAHYGVTLRDNLDAQSVIWALTTATHESELLGDWTDEDRKAFFAWREGALGTPSTEEVDDKPSAVPAEPGLDPLQWAARECHLPVDYLERVVSLLSKKGQLVFYGPPGTGKTYVAQVLARALTQHDAKRSALVQFHPSTTYEDFFEGIRPRTDDRGTLHYEVRPGPLARMAALAADDPDRQYVMVIDELNRANLPKVLGELLFLLEYRNREALTLYRPEEPFKLPKNLWFIATMNTVDRSVALIDAAMRRRFHFVPFYPDTQPISDVLSLICTDDEAWVAELVERVNAQLVADLGGRDHQLGASDFITAARTPDGLEEVWRHSIEPLIEDQLFGQEDRVKRYRWERIVEDHADLIPDGHAVATAGPDEMPAADVP